jgi:ABC-type glycerol-3-phosphate transport system permease component
VAIFSFLQHWDSFLGPLIYLNTMEKFTLPLGLRYFQLTARTGGAPKENLLMAASLMVALPGIILFFFMQRHFVQGIVLTGIKG